MDALLRRIRGAIKMGFLWAFAWSGAGVAMAFITGFTADVPFPLLFGVFGFLAGVSFSTVLALADGRRGFEQMSLPRFGGWGAVGGGVLAVVFTRLVSFGLADTLMVVSLFGLASAVCATGSLALARRAAPPELPRPNE